MKRRVGLIVFVSLVVAFFLFCFASSEGQTIQNKKTFESFQSWMRLFDEDVPNNAAVNDKYSRWLQWWLNDSGGYLLTVCERLSELEPYLDDLLEKHDLHTDFKYLFAWESGLDGTASSRYAVGFAQFKRSTGRQYGLQITSLSDKNEEWDIDERRCPKAFEAAALYLSKLKDQFANVSLAAAAYNTGGATIDLKTKEQKTNNYWLLFSSNENEDFLYHILTLKVIYEGNVVKFPRRDPITFDEITVKLSSPTPLHEVLRKQLGLSEEEAGTNARWNRHIREGVVPAHKTVTIFVQKPYIQTAP